MSRDYEAIRDAAKALFDLHRETSEIPPQSRSAIEHYAANLGRNRLKHIIALTEKELIRTENKT